MAIVIKKRVKLDMPIKVDSLTGVAFTTEAEAHQFVVQCEQHGEDLTLTGTVSAKFIRADGNTIQLVGSIDDGAAVVTLVQDCYNVQGRFQLAIFNTVGDTKLCIYACVGTVQKTQSGSLIDGGSVIDDVEDLIADIQTAVQSIPPDYTTLLASIAGTYSASDTYAVGDYAWYNGSLYRCTTAITTAEAWTAGHWTAAVLGNDISSLKSAFTLYNDKKINKQSDWALGYYGFGSGNPFTDTKRIRTETDLPLNVSEIYCISGIIDFYAWNGTSYIGHWNGELFVTDNASSELTYVNVDSIRTQFPSYRYRLVWRQSASSTSAINTGYCAYVAMLDSDARYAISPDYFGAVGDGVANDWSPVSDCLKTAIALKRNVVFRKATYLVASAVNINGAVNIDGNSAVLKFGGNSGGTSVLVINAETEAGNRCAIKNLTIDMNEIAGYGIRIEKNVNAFTFHDIQVNKVSTAGVGVYCANNGGGKFNNFILRCNIRSNSAKAFEVHAPDTVLDGIIAVNFSVGISAYSNIQIINYHPWNSFAELMTSSIGLYTESLVILTNSYIDTFAKCFAGTGYLCISGLMCFWSTEYYTDESVGDSETLPIIFSGENLHVIACDGMRVYKPYGRTLQQVKYCDSANQDSLFNPRVANLLEGVTGINSVTFTNGDITYSENVTGSQYDVLKMYEDYVVLMAYVRVAGLSNSATTPLMTLPSRAIPRTQKVWVCEAVKVGANSTKTVVEVLVNGSSGVVSARSINGNLNDTYEIQITQEYRVR